MSQTPEQSFGEQTTPAPAITAPAAATPRSFNIERLLDVELSVVVRFGLTHIPLREVARMGAGSFFHTVCTRVRPEAGSSRRKPAMNARRCALGKVVQLAAVMRS